MLTNVMRCKLILVFLALFILGTIEPGGEFGWSQDSVELKDASSDSLDSAPSQEISVGSDNVRDESIEERLQAVYREIPNLANVQIEVNAGVIQLTGQTPTKEDHEKALELARRVEGVVSVTDRITQKREVGERLTHVQERLENHFNEFISYLPLLIIALAVFWHFGFFLPLSVDGIAFFTYSRVMRFCKDY